MRRPNRTTNQQSQRNPPNRSLPPRTHERQVLDFWQAKKSIRPAPVLFFI
jgi:hypothetical protein